MLSLANNIGIKIRQIRKQQNLSQTELANKCGLHTSYIGQVERGEKNITVESLYKICQGLGVNVSYIFPPTESCDDGIEDKIYQSIKIQPIHVQQKLLCVVEDILKLC